jgi:hypothetical protein
VKRRNQIRRSAGYCHSDYQKIDWQKLPGALQTACAAAALN